MQVELMEPENRRNKIHPKKFALYVACASIGMMFTAFTSAYIVRQAGGNWLEFELPGIFLWNTLVIIASSVTLQLANYSFKKGRKDVFRAMLIASFGLGLAFLGLQYEGWTQLMEIGVPLGANPSGDFIYVVSGVHAAHLVGGITALLVTLIVAFARPFKQTAARKLRLNLVTIYWHFVGFLWVYLIGFWTLQG